MTFMTPKQLGKLRTKAERLEALWTGWAEFLTNEGNETLFFQITDPAQGKINRKDLDTVLRVYASLKEASGEDPTKATGWAKALELHKARRQISPYPRSF